VSDPNSLIEFLNHQAETQARRALHRLEPPAYAAAEAPFFFTLCARGNGEPFRQPAIAEAVVAALLWRRRHHRWLLRCYCLMPDHLHFIAELTASDVPANAGARGLLPKGILEHVRDFKKYTTSQVWQRSGGVGSLWQASSYDRVLRATESLEDACHYVLNNPVRKGLVSCWEEYPYSGIIDDWRPVESGG
jgi:putative transposase